jgi:hypothetical protein
MPDEIAINIPEIEAEISKLSPDEMQKQLLTIRVRQKTQQKKHYDPEKMKQYQMKQREKAKALKTRALGTPATKPGFANMWEQINAEAEAEADRRIAEENTPEDEETATA